MKVPLIYTEISVPNKDPRKTLLDRRPFIPAFNAQSFEGTEDLHMAYGKNMTSKNTITMQTLKGYGIGGDHNVELKQSRKTQKVGAGLPLSEVTGRKPGKIKKAKATNLGARGLE